MDADIAAEREGLLRRMRETDEGRKSLVEELEALRARCPHAPAPARHVASCAGHILVWFDCRDCGKELRRRYFDPENADEAFRGDWGPGPAPSETPGEA